MRSLAGVLLVACATAPPPPDPASGCIAGKAPPGLQVEVRPIDVAPPLIVGKTGSYEICGLRSGLYRVAFARELSEMVVDVPLGPGQRYRIDVCETRLAVERWPVNVGGELGDGEPPRQIEPCRR